MKTPLETGCLFLAPMHGVTDYAFRELISENGGLDLCVTEFIRVSHQLLPKKEFTKHCPELLHEGTQKGKTKSGTPVMLQILGGQALVMAENAARASELGAVGIDLNFGCPAPVVNRHDGGAVLLKHPNRLYEISRAVRLSVDNAKPVSAKIRLGYENPDLAITNAQALESAGISWITVHARTKTDGYRPPAYWEWITKIRESVKIPVVANGEIWNFTDLNNCRRETGCESFMIGRGILRNPFLFQSLHGSLGDEDLDCWHQIHLFLKRFFKQTSLYISPLYAQARTKLWLNNLKESSPEALELFSKIKAIHDPVLFAAQLNSEPSELAKFRASDNLTSNG